MGMRQNIVLLVCIAGVISKEDWTGRQKDVKDMSDADLHKLLEEWDKDEEPIPPDELPDGHQEPKRSGRDNEDQQEGSDSDAVCEGERLQRGPGRGGRDIESLADRADEQPRDV